MAGAEKFKFCCFLCKNIILITDFLEKNFAKITSVSICWFSKFKEGFENENSKWDDGSNRKLLMYLK